MKTVLIWVLDFAFYGRPRGGYTVLTGGMQFSLVVSLISIWRRMYFLKLPAFLKNTCFK